MVAINAFIYVLGGIALGLVPVQAQFADIARSARAEAEMLVRRRNVASLARSPRTGPAVYRPYPPMTAFGFAAGAPSSRQRLSTAAKLSKVHGSRTVPPAYSDASRVFQTASTLYLQRTGAGAFGAAPTPAAVAGFREALTGICPQRIICDPWYPYRLPDGRCNNLFFPYQGSAFTPQPRLLPPAYENFFDSPRLHGVGGVPLHSPRHISNMVHQGLGGEIPELGITLYLMQWGQLTDHDIVLTPIATETDGKPLICALGGLQNIPNIGNPECLNIRINLPPGDPYFPPTYIWMNFVRSLAAISSSCIPGPRQQLNKITSYIDASNVYGSSEEEQVLLRVPGGIPKGRLREGPFGGHHLPQGTGDCDIVKGTPPDYCLMAGDERVMEQPTLSMIHTVFMREHNRIAAILEGLHPLWTDEKIFQETRKIVAAEMQHITYNEYLPLLLGPAYTAFFQLRSVPFGFNFVYSPFVDASIVNVFAAASYRYGHSQVPNEMGKNFVVNAPPFQTVLLEDHFFRPNWILKPPGTGLGVDRISRYTATANSQAVDSRIEQSVRNKLFQDGVDSLDLPALNIQRGRDHGLPPYNAYRQLCGRPPYITWNDALMDHSPEIVDRLRNAYSSPQDIDIFTGALSERPVPGGYLGPTNACIIGNQFWRLKRGDRFFYENPFPLTGFTLAQLNSIKTTTLARIICRNTNTPMIQTRIFHKVGPGNPMVACASLPDIDLSLWTGLPTPLGNSFPGHPVAPPMSPLSAFKFQRPPKFLVPNIPIGKGVGKPPIHKAPVKAHKM